MVGFHRHAALCAGRSTRLARARSTQAHCSRSYYPLGFDDGHDRAHDGGNMKPAPQVPGDTDAERMKNALRMMFSVPKEAYLREEARLKRARDRKWARKQPA